MNRRAGALAVLGVWVLVGPGAALPPDGAGDWPMWRHDAAHTAATPLSLALDLQPHWIRALPPLTPGWPDQPRMQLDAQYEPVVVGQTLYLPSSRSDSLTAYDTRSAAEKWVFFADGPVRYPAAAWAGRVYFTSDDGCLYCLDGDKGGLLWKFFGGPRDRRVLGNERLISTWPARGAPVVADGTVYFASGIWPFMGIFLYALDATTGRVVWSNEGDGAAFIKQPHNTESFAGIAPQGPMTVIGDRLLVSGGRSVPAAYDRKSGVLQYFKFADNSRRGGVDVAAAGSYFYAGGSAYDLATGSYAGEAGRALVATPEAIWYADKKKDILTARPPIATTIDTIDRKGSKSSKPMWKMSPAKTIDAPKTECLIKAGERFYLGVDKGVVAIEQGKEVWRQELLDTPAAMLAADDRLFVVTRDAHLYCFGAGRVPTVTRTSPFVDPAPSPEGIRVLFSAAPSAEALARGRVIAVLPDPQGVEALRTTFHENGISRSQVEFHAGTPESFPLPPYLATAIVCDSRPTPGILAHLYPALRPYGGKLFLPKAGTSRDDLEGMIVEAGLLCAEIEETETERVVVRSGALPGAGNWTHEHADAANTRVSRDRVVRAPLGMLWFGGPTHDGILPRHGHGPQPQVVDGRLIIEGIDKMRATDIYTGRILWEVPLQGVGDFYNNVVHQAGANGTGTNFISTADGIYVAYRNKCLRLDPATGKTLSEFLLPGKPSVWGYLNVVGDVLLGGADPLLDVTVQRAVEGGFDDPNAPADALIKKLASFKGDNDSLSASRRLVAFDRRSGKVLWQAQATAAFRHNAICAGGGRLYAIDRLSGAQVDRLKKKNETPKSASRIVAFDLKDGREVWKDDVDVFGTWLSYSEAHDILVEAGRVARDTLMDEAKGMRARRGADGAELWRKGYLGPAMIHGDTILMADRACELASGQAIGRLHPLTQQPVEWSWTRTYGCNTPSASENLMTFRSGAAGFFDLAGDGGTGNFGGFRSSCTNNLIVAGGLLNAPDYTRTCICSYQNQASVALVPMPEAEEWTFFGDDKVKGPVRRIGVNLGAPGDRRGPDGTLWVEHPSVGGKSPSASVGLNPDKLSMFRKNPLRISGNGLPWVSASGARGLKELTLPLDKDAKEERLYTVRLHFVEPDGLGSGERVFDVSLQGKVVLKDFDVAREAGGADLALVREFREVAAKRELKVSFKDRVGTSVLCGVEVAPSCRIPLFRYALERWAADPYEYALHAGGAVDSGRDIFALDRPPDPKARLEIAFPSKGRPLLWSGPADPKGYAAALDSPARRELLQRLLAGQSAVWVLVEGGEKEKDDAAAALLDSTLKELEGSLKLPELRDVPEDALVNKTVPLALDFSVLRVSRTDPAEAMLVRMLLRGAGGPATGPAAFPVFGRGRAMTGTEVTPEAIRRAAEFLVAPCVQEAKASVPGMDLLIRADWTGLVGEVPGKVTDIPPGSMLPLQKPEEEYVYLSGEIDRGSAGYQIYWLLAAAAGILVGFLSFRARRKGAPR